MKIVYNAKAHSKLFACFKEMANIGAAVITAGLAVTQRIYRSWIIKILFVVEIDLSEIKSTVAFPHLPENTKTFDEIDDIKIDQVVIGSCTNGQYKDLAEAAEIIRGRKVAKNVRAIIIPATQDIYLKAMETGILRDFIEAGCVVSTPTCGPCLGGYMGILAAGERAVATTNRNFVGRMGDVTSEVYLASPAVAAASAIAGKIADPLEIMKA